MFRTPFTAFFLLLHPKHAEELGGAANAAAGPIVPRARGWRKCAAPVSGPARAER